MTTPRLGTSCPWASVLLGALVAALLVFTPWTSGAAVRRVAHRATQWGFYSNGSGGSEGLVAWEARMPHKRFKFIGEYVHIGEASKQPVKIGRQAMARGATLYLNLSPVTGSGDSKTCIGGANGWADFASGKEDHQYLAPWVKAFKSPRQ